MKSRDQNSDFQKKKLKKCFIKSKNVCATAANYNHDGNLLSFLGAKHFSV